MLISALTDYYDILAKNNKLIKDGYSAVNISYLICLSPNGEIAAIVPHRQEIINSKGKSKFAPKSELFPKRVETTKILANIIEHRPLYIFGIDCTKGVYAINNKSEKSHLSFIKEQNAFLSSVKKTPLIEAYINFINSWNASEQCENPHLLEISKDYGSSGYAFCLDGYPQELLNSCGEVCEAWDNSISNLPDEAAVELSQCAITGKPAKIARLHNNLKGIVGGQMSGVNIVCFKENAYESYGKEQSYNSSISEEVMVKYTTAFNYLTSDNKHKVVIDGATILFWSDDGKGDDEEVDLFNMFAFGNNSLNADEMDNELLNAILSAKNGVPLKDILSLDIDDKMNFYIVGVMPNASRLAIKFLYKNSFENLLNNCIQHQLDFCVNKNDKPVALWQILKQLKSPKSTKENISPDLSTKILNAILLGADYPIELLHKVVQRVKTDLNEENNQYLKINNIRIGIIKACVNRKLRNQNKTEEFTMSLDLGNKSPAYLCGRLFAVLEKVQKDSSTVKLNKTIADSYFSAACSTPSTVFSRLMKLSQYHLAKLSCGACIYYKNLIKEIVDGFKKVFPTTLTLDEQCEFIVGYYQQNKSLYTTKEKENMED